MLLIIFLGLIANLALFCDGCDIGTQSVNSVNFTKALGTWYVLLHSPDVFEETIECMAVTYAYPEGNVGLITVKAFDISLQSYVTLYGNATNWTNTTLDEYFLAATVWSGRYYIIAIDYDSYVILKSCTFATNELHTYVAFRSNSPDEDTVRRVKAELQQNNINATQLVNWPACNGH